ncbi:D-2-hydroxyacid dehydrogenase [Mesorhizobium sp. M7A.F.Ca.US.011.01.1.1]|uniref:D-2-hydroxyacid dehydrogenase n=1 Tax=Mesorhizobium sp. M7A.F.Ca.US.011.01.1.1 TaxID=2496741 RepID=UPI000FCBEB0C|nr:D-2-hydroxyacid dehydrogenase [Mesorhizobium sp. M7A.F.Ca.US.011.01.1.1]RUX22607.1 D-2-hydroxyacid dehydrogenase [Mesorhizobium sp. M7A.F.Ca.US.011.01.1.1]
MQRPSIYVENKLPETSPYHVSSDAVRRALAARSLDAEVIVRPEADPDLEALKAATYFVGSGFDTARLKEHASNVKLVHCTSAGVEKYLPIDWLTPGTMFTNSSGVHARKGGVFGAMAILMALEEVPRHAYNQRRHLWEARLTTGVSGKTVVFVGTGALGSAIAAQVKPFGVMLIGISRSGGAVDSFDQVFGRSELQTVLPKADCLVLACPLTAETRNMISDEELGLLKPRASVFNIARSGVMDYAALARALRSGHLSCAILDVFDREPLPSDDVLWDVPNLTIFPHVSCDDHDGYIDRCLGVFAENFARHQDGEPLLNVVDPASEY